MNIKSIKTTLVLISFFSVNLGVFAAPSIVPAPPKIKASSYLVMDFNSGDLLVKENIEQRLPPASLTKIMTVYIVASKFKNGKIALNDEVLISEKAWRTEGSRMFIEVNKKVKVDDLLYGVIVQSGNDASVALAEYISGTEAVFVDLMNQHAQLLGMKNTHYTNSTGLPDEKHYTTAMDLAILTRAFINNFPEIYIRHSIKEFTFNKIKQYNRNKLLWRDGSVDGLKTGHTEEAGYCLVASASREGMRLISIVMGADGNNARTKASQSLINYGYRFYETRKLYSAGDLVTSKKIWKADVETINLGLKQDIYVTFSRGQYDKLKSIAEINEPLLAPVNQGEQKGSLNIMLADQKIKTVSLVALQTVPEGGVFNRIKDKIYLLFY